MLHPCRLDLRERSTISRIPLQSLGKKGSLMGNQQVMSRVSSGGLPLHEHHLSRLCTLIIGVGIYDTSIVTKVDNIE